MNTAISTTELGEFTIPIIARLEFHIADHTIPRYRIHVIQHSDPPALETGTITSTSDGLVIRYLDEDKILAHVHNPFKHLIPTTLWYQGLKMEKVYLLTSPPESGWLIRKKQDEL